MKNEKAHLSYYKACAEEEIKTLLGITRKPLEDDMANARILASVEQKIADLIVKEMDSYYHDVDLMLERGPLGKRFAVVQLHWANDPMAGINGGHLKLRYQGRYPKESENSVMTYTCLGEVAHNSHLTKIKDKDLEEASLQIGELLTAELQMNDFVW